jgi:hypothetical protein
LSPDASPFTAFHLGFPPLTPPMLEALRLALETIANAKLRSFFTLLGIIVSVAFLVAVVAVIQGMNAYVRENLAGAIIGTNAFQVRRTPISVGLLDDEEIPPSSQAPADHRGRMPRRQARPPRRRGGGAPVGVAGAPSRCRLRQSHRRRRADLRRHPALPDGAGLPRSRRRAAHRRGRAGRRPVGGLGFDVADKLFGTPESPSGGKVRVAGPRVHGQGRDRQQGHACSGSRSTASCCCRSRSSRRSTAAAAPRSSR